MELGVGKAPDLEIAAAISGAAGGIEHHAAHRVARPRADRTEIIDAEFYPAGFAVDGARRNIGLKAEDARRRYLEIIAGLDAAHEAVGIEAGRAAPSITAMDAGIEPGPIE